MCERGEKRVLVVSLGVCSASRLRRGWASSAFWGRVLLLVLVLLLSSRVKTRASQMLCQSRLRRSHSSSFGARCAETNVMGTVSSLSPTNPILAPTAPLLPIS